MLSKYMKDDQTGKERKEFRKSMKTLNLEVRRAIPKMRSVLVNVVK